MAPPTSCAAPSTKTALKAYKLLAPALDRPVEDEAGYPVWEACAELDIPGLDSLRHSWQRRRRRLA